MKKKNLATVLVIDVGNTSTAYGLNVGGKITRKSRILTHESGMPEVLAAVRRICGRSKIHGAVLSSVVPKVNKHWHAAVRHLYPGARWLVLNHKLKLGVNVTYPKPDSIGADRLANACEASRRFGTPVIVADFGTAVTFDVVSKTKGYIGGVIAPGLPLMFKYLSEKTALLPEIKPGPVRHKVGRSTEEAMRLGAIWGYRGLVREILGELGSGLGEPDLKVCATGGYAEWVLKDSGMDMPIDPDLTLLGLGRIYELNA